jgi:hypothetical protein
VPDHFSCSIKLTATPQFDALLREVATGVLQQACYTPTAIAKILDEFRASLDKHAAEGVRGCHAAFRHEGGRLIIDVTYAGGGEWHLTRPLPSPD